MLMIKHQQPFVASRDNCRLEGWVWRKVLVIGQQICLSGCGGIGLGLAGLRVVSVVLIHLLARLLSARPLLQAAAAPVSFVLERLSHGEFKNTKSDIDTPSIAIQ